VWAHVERTALHVKSRLAGGGVVHGGVKQVVQGPVGGPESAGDAGVDQTVKERMALRSGRRVALTPLSVNAIPRINRKNGGMLRQYSSPGCYDWLARSSRNSISISPRTSGRM